MFLGEGKKIRNLARKAHIGIKDATSLCITMNKPGWESNDCGALVQGTCPSLMPRPRLQAEPGREGCMLGIYLWPASASEVLRLALLEEV